jgi:nicotinamidase-related amidase
MAEENNTAPAKNEDLHGNVPDSSPVVLLLIDVINDLEWPGGELLLEHARTMAPRLARLKQRAREAGIPVVYVNDNFGRWRSDMRSLLAHCLGDVRGKPMVEQLQPEKDDYFVLKPKHSAFYSTTLDTLLDYLGARTLILTGVAGNICILFSANDAYMRDFHLVVPRDCIASNTVEDNEHAIRLMETVLKVDTTPSKALDLEALVASPSTH